MAFHPRPAIRRYFEKIEPEYPARTQERLLALGCRLYSRDFLLEYERRCIEEYIDPVSWILLQGSVLLDLLQKVLHAFMFVAFGVVALAMLIAAINRLSSNSPSLLPEYVLQAGGFVIICWIGVVWIKSWIDSIVHQPHWVDVVLGPNTIVPAQVIELARRVQALYPQATFSVRSLCRRRGKFEGYMLEVRVWPGQLGHIVMVWDRKNQYVSE